MGGDRVGAGLGGDTARQDCDGSRPEGRTGFSTFTRLLIPFGSVIVPLAVWLTSRDRDPFIDQAGREALNFGITIAIYGTVLLVAALMLVGIPFLIIGVVAWVVLASLAATKAGQGHNVRQLRELQQLAASRAAPRSGISRLAKPVRAWPCSVGNQDR